MDFVYAFGIWIILCVLTALLARFIVVKIAKRNGHTSDTMPKKYHAWAIGAYFTIVYPALFFLNYIF